MTLTIGRQLAEGLRSADTLVLARWEKLEADISHFVEGGYVNWSLLKWLAPKKYEHWVMRSVRPRPSIRVFGRFACPDVFVATHAVLRISLKGKWSLEWEMEKLRCEDQWRIALGTLPPFSASEYEDYFTENAGKDVRVEP